MKDELKKDINTLSNRKAKKSSAKKLQQEYDTSEILSNFITHQLREAVDFKSKYDEMYQELDTFVRGEQWATTNGAMKREWHGKPVTNYLHIVENAKTSDITYEDVKPRLLPLSSEHIEQVDLLEKVLQNAWLRTNAHSHINDAVKNSRRYPFGVTKVEHNNNKIVGEIRNQTRGEISLKTINPIRFFWDPAAFEIEDAEFAFESIRVSKSWLLRHKDFDQKLVAEIIKATETDMPAGSPEAGEIFNDTREYATENANIYILYEVYIKYPLNEHNDAVLKAYICNNRVLWKKDKLETPILPYSIIKEFKEPQSFIGKSSVMLTLDNQMFINKIDGIVHNIATQHQNPQKIVSTDSGIDAQDLAEYGDVPGGTFLADGDPTKAVYTMKPIEISPTLLNITASKKEDIMAVAGITKVQQGDTGSVTTAGGVNSLIAQSDKKDADTAIQYQQYLKRIVDIMLFYIKEHKEKVEHRINGDPNQPFEFYFLDIKPNQFKDVRHDVIIDVPQSQTEKQRSRSELLQLMNIQAQTGETLLTTPDIIKMLGFPDTERLISAAHMAEAGKIRQREMQVAQLTGELIMQSLSKVGPGVQIQELIKEATIQAVELVEKEATSKMGSGNKGAAGTGAPQKPQ